ncbi:transglutaminase-like putative cysteine protease [Kibdelosporangium banguiense]|uniref:Transglutaminase-like putative cysteine protease n=1 Tax=Kibdelosporangium banguiense TaxID=1365924 RepID=A0ABS4U1J2_9PSEU|nr:transglutaminase domain-containing protein [Kibdelosporangium banguiense]MBP2330524.1 transglutaminase-like putative cysteine protease [Kibdelosporangium banguiense]
MSALRVGWSVAILAIGAVQLARGWAGIVAVAVFLAAIVITYGLVFTGRKLGFGAGYTVLIVLSLAVAGAYFAAGSVVSPTDPTEKLSVLDTLTGTVPRLLSMARPAPATAMLLIPGVLLVIVVSLVAAMSLRGRALLAPAGGAAVLYTAAALLTAGQADRTGLVAVVLVALTGLGWLIIDRPRTGRRYLVLPAMLLVVLAGLTTIATILPAANAFDPRRLVKPPVTELSVASPLPKLTSWAAASGAELFRVRGPEVPLRLVTLSDYNGASWRAASLYGPIGAVAPPDLPDGGQTSSSDIEITVEKLTGSWMPTAGRPSATNAEAAVVDPDSGSMVLPAGLAEGMRYRLTSTLDTPDDESLRAATVPSGPAARRYLSLPGLPSALAEYARRTVANSRTPFERAIAIEEVVRADRRPSADAPAGSSYTRLESFLFGTGSVGANAGTAEQFASAFAVLARAAGLPSRVVVGFRPVQAGPDGTAVVRGSDATAWPEVYFDKWGWVAFDPMAGDAAGPSSAARRDVLNRLAAMPPAPPPSAVPGAVPSPRQPTAAAPVAPKNERSYLLLLGLVPVVMVLVLGMMRAGRRSRLRRAGATGAWVYVLDALLLAGRSPARHVTAPDVARGLAEPDAVRLAELADRAAFAPGPPLGGADAWRLAVKVRSGVRREVPWYRKLFWALDPRPLWRR